MRQLASQTLLALALAVNGLVDQSAWAGNGCSGALKKRKIHLSVDETLPNVVGQAIRYAAVRLDLSSDGPTRGELQAEGARIAFNGFYDMQEIFQTPRFPAFGRTATVFSQTPKTLTLYDWDAREQITLPIGPLDPPLAIYLEGNSPVLPWK